MRPSSLGLPGLLCAGSLLVTVPRPARAESGDGIGIGPVIAITPRDSVSIGWELGVARPAPFARFSLGGSYHLRPHPKDPPFLHYVAWEPWAYVGGTLGAALTSAGQVRAVLGVWEGFAESFDGDLYGSDGENWVLSLSLGWCAVGSTHQLYSSLKLWRMDGWDFSR